MMNAKYHIIDMHKMINHRMSISLAAVSPILKDGVWTKKEFFVRIVTDYAGKKFSLEFLHRLTLTGVEMHQPIPSPTEYRYFSSLCEWIMNYSAGKLIDLAEHAPIQPLWVRRSIRQAFSDVEASVKGGVR